MFPVYAFASECKHDMHCCTVQSALAQIYAGLVPPLVYLADDMVRDADPQVLWLVLHDRSAVSSIPWYEGCSADMSIWLITGIERVLSQDELQFLRVRSAKQEIMVSARMFLLTS